MALLKRAADALLLRIRQPCEDYPVMNTFYKLVLHALMSTLLLVFTACGAEPDSAQGETVSSQSQGAKAIAPNPKERKCAGQTTYSSTVHGLTVPDCATKATRDAFCAQQKGCVRSINACRVDQPTQTVKLDCCCPAGDSPL